MTQSDATAFGLVDVAARLGALAWVSGHLFRIEGEWAEAMSDPAAVVHLATNSRHHGGHVGMLTAALPDSASLDATAHVAAPSSGWAAAVDMAEELPVGDDLGTDTARLAYLYRGLLPRVVSMLVDLDDRLRGPGDAHLSRTVRLIRPDVDSDAQRGHRLLETTLCDEKAVETACSVTKALDEAFRT